MFQFLVVLTTPSRRSRKVPVYLVSRVAVRRVHVDLLAVDDELVAAARGEGERVQGRLRRAPWRGTSRGGGPGRPPPWRRGWPRRCAGGRGRVRRSTAGESPKSSARRCSMAAAMRRLALGPRREQDVAGLDVRGHIGVAQGLEGGPQLVHGDAPVAGDVDAPEQGDVAGHARNLPGLGRRPGARRRHRGAGRSGRRSTGGRTSLGQVGQELAEQRAELERVPAGAAADDDRPTRSRTKSVSAELS